MGLTTSKSPLERRNTVIKRSQRKAIHTLKSKIDKVFQDIRKFRGTEEDEKYKVLISEIGHLNHELNNKIRDLQPQVKNIHQVTVARLQEAERALETKVQENKEKLQKKQMEEKRDPDDGEVLDNEDESAQYQNRTEEVIDQPTIEETNESRVLENSTDKRKTVELKVLQVIPDPSIQVEVHNEQMSPNFRSPGDKRKSILKMGIPVMPGAMLEEMTKKTKQMSVHYDAKEPAKNSDALLTKVTDTIEHLQKIEYQIADFVGKKHGTQYNRIKDKLEGFQREVTQINTDDDFVVDQIELCTNYIKSCLRFLDDKAVESNKDELQDDVFLPQKNNTMLNGDDVQTKLLKLTKTTAI